MSRIFIIRYNNKVESGGSAAMEPAGIKTSVEFLKESGLQIDHYVTDRSTTVRALFAEHFPEINHQVKNIIP